jgi:hypothetical protein
MNEEYDYQVYSAMEEFWRIFGAPRQKPGFPLQVLGIAYAIPVGFPLQSLAQRQLRTSPGADGQNLSIQGCHVSPYTGFT